MTKINNYVILLVCNLTTESNKYLTDNRRTPEKGGGGKVEKIGRLVLLQLGHLFVALGNLYEMGANPDSKQASDLREEWRKAFGNASREERRALFAFLFAPVLAKEFSLQYLAIVFGRESGTVRAAREALQLMDRLSVGFTGLWNEEFRGRLSVQWDAMKGKEHSALRWAAKTAALFDGNLEDEIGARVDAFDFTADPFSFIVPPPEDADKADKKTVVDEATDPESGDESQSAEAPEPIQSAPAVSVTTVVEPVESESPVAEEAMSDEDLADLVPEPPPAETVSLKGTETRMENLSAQWSSLCSEVFELEQEYDAEYERLDLTNSKKKVPQKALADLETIRKLVAEKKRERLIFAAQLFSEGYGDEQFHDLTKVLKEGDRIVGLGETIRCARQTSQPAHATCVAKPIPGNGKSARPFEPGQSAEDKTSEEAARENETPDANASAEADQTPADATPENGQPSEAVGAPTLVNAADSRSSIDPKRIEKERARLRRIHDTIQFDVSITRSSCEDLSRKYLAWKSTVEKSVADGEVVSDEDIKKLSEMLEEMNEARKMLAEEEKRLADAFTALLLFNNPDNAALILASRPEDAEDEAGLPEISLSGSRSEDNALSGVSSEEVQTGIRVEAIMPDGTRCEKPLNNSLLTDDGEPNIVDPAMDDTLNVVRAKSGDLNGENNLGSEAFQNAKEAREYLKSLGRHGKLFSRLATDSKSDELVEVANLLAFAEKSPKNSKMYRAFMEWTSNPPTEEGARQIVSFLRGHATSDNEFSDDPKARGGILRVLANIAIGVGAFVRLRSQM